MKFVAYAVGMVMGLTVIAYGAWHFFKLMNGVQ